MISFFKIVLYIFTYETQLKKTLKSFPPKSKLRESTVLILNHIK